MYENPTVLACRCEHGMATDMFRHEGTRDGNVKDRKMEVPLAAMADTTSAAAVTRLPQNGSPSGQASATGGGRSHLDLRQMSSSQLQIQGSQQQPKRERLNNEE